MSKKLNIEFIRAEFKKEGYELLTKVYENNRQKLDYICPRGHRHSITWANWNSKKKPRCPYCVDNKIDIGFIRAEFAKEDYKLLTKVYENNKQKLECICPMGTKYFTTWANWQQGVRCPCSSKQVELTAEFVRAEFAKEDYILLTKVCKDSKQKLEYICPNGHQRFINWNSWQQGERCPCFSNQMKPNIEFIRAKFAEEGYTLLTETYENNIQKLDYICPIGHKHSVIWKCWNSKRKQRCPSCNNTGISKWEKSVKKFLTESNIDYISNDRTQLLNPGTGCNLELDIWFPDLNKAIECNGIYWHDKKRAIKNDKIKQQLCEDQNIDLLVITDEEWKNDTDKCKNKIQEFFC